MMIFKLSNLCFPKDIKKYSTYKIKYPKNKQYNTVQTE